PNNENPRIHETPPPRGQTLRLRRRPRFEPTPDNQPSIHPDPPELTDSTLSPPQTSSTQVKPKAESINRLFEISSVAIHHNHREEDFTRTITVNHGRASNVLRRHRHQSKPNQKHGEARHGTPSPPGSLRLPEAKPNSRTRNFTTPSSTRPRLYAINRSATGGLNSGKAEERGDESKAKIEGCNGGLRGSGDCTHAHAPAGHRTRF
ncbi:LOW QUALITY PROTEIN: hypothetical protein HID58_012133, partial [Brassica napus]